VPNTSSTPIRRDGDKSWHRRSRPVADSSPSRLDVQAQVQEHKIRFAANTTLQKVRRSRANDARASSLRSPAPCLAIRGIEPDLDSGYTYICCSLRVQDVCPVERRLLAYVFTGGQSRRPDWRMVMSSLLKYMIRQRIQPLPRLFLSNHQTGYRLPSYMNQHLLDSLCGVISRVVVSHEDGL